VKGAPGVKTTAAVSDAVPLAAVMTAVPARVELIDEVAMPLVVVRGESTVPRFEVKVTVVALATGLLYRSTTVAVSVLVFPTVRLAGLASSVTVKGAPGVKTTAAVPDTVPLAAVMTAVPARVELIDEVAMPLVVKLGESTVPMSEVKVTVVPSATGLLDSSTTVAVSVLVFPTVRLAGLASSVTVKGAPSVKTTAAVSDAVPLVAVMTAVPTRVEVIDEVATPLVVKLGESAVPMSEVKVTVVPLTTGLWY
jgi:DNA/RNA-binding domain of Phe-tRNA-synthetase-like protein